MAPLVELAAQALLDVRRSSIFSTLCRIAPLSSHLPLTCAYGFRQDVFRRFKGEPREVELYSLLLFLQPTDGPLLAGISGLV